MKHSTRTWLDILNTFTIYHRFGRIDGLESLCVHYDKCIEHINTHPFSYRKGGFSFILIWFSSSFSLYSIYICMVRFWMLSFSCALWVSGNELASLCFGTIFFRMVVFFLWGEKARERQLKAMERRALHIWRRQATVLFKLGIGTLYVYAYLALYFLIRKRLPFLLSSNDFDVVSLGACQLFTW